jgi:trans-2,3-dihydro-3-hydroxyanthranilate isomerase
MRSYRYLHYDVFSARVCAGNQLAVFLDGRGLSDDQMQAIAREMNFSESTFVFPPEEEGTDVRVRIFTPIAELPIAGHPTIGTAFGLAHAGTISAGQAQVVFGLGVGPTPVDLTWNGDALSFAWMTQPLPQFGVELDLAEQAAAALSLPPEAVTATLLPVQTVSCGVPYLIIPLKSRADVDAAVVDTVAYAKLARLAHLGLEGLYLFTTDTGPNDSATVYTRMFGPGIGIAEDPATGSAAGPLGCYLLVHAVLDPPKAATIMNLQGVHMGRPSLIHTAITGTTTGVTSVRVGGEAVLAGEGSLYL